MYLYLSTIIKKTQEYEDEVFFYHCRIQSENLSEKQCRLLIDSVCKILLDYHQMKKYSFDVYDYDLEKTNSINSRCKLLILLLMVQRSLIKLKKI